VGTDFIDKSKRSFEKHLDTKRAKLATADLFTREIGDVCETFPADIADNAQLTSGEALHAEMVGGVLVLTRALHVVGVAHNPPAAVVEAIRDSCGVATAIVQEIHIFAGTVEVTLC
jgi:hypothetical protein